MTEVYIQRTATYISPKMTHVRQQRVSSATAELLVIGMKK